MKIVILGGGTAGWMAASALANYLKNTDNSITLIESSDVGTIGVGEATLPGIRIFNQSLGINEIEFIKATQATFKLGIQFNNWREDGSTFFHPFSGYGAPIDGLDFYQCWLRSKHEGNTCDLDDYCFSSQMARRGRFAPPPPKPTSPLTDYYYAYHFDATLYAAFLRRYSENLGVTRIDALLHRVSLNKESGYIESIALNNNDVISGDLFIDCSGFKGLLIEQALNVGYEDWSHWLPCNSAIAVRSASHLPPTPFTITTAKKAGWQWRIPLQHRVGNGYVYCNDYISDAAAQDELLDSLDGGATSETKQLRFTTGRRKKFWHKNCVALGLASGFMEPLESTSISLIDTGISRLLRFFPWQGINEVKVAEANRTAKLEYERIRDFLILHYKANQRTDGGFWDYCRDMSIPDTLAHKMELFKQSGDVIRHELESFEYSSWITMYNGFGIKPSTYDYRTNRIGSTDLKTNLAEIKKSIDQATEKIITHADFIALHCATKEL
jgi:tryptophan halogenase